MEREKTKLGSTVPNRVSQDFLPILFPFPVKADCLQVSSKLVTPYPRLQGCFILNNRTGDSTGEPSLLWVSFVDPCLVFALIQCVALCLGSDL